MADPTGNKAFTGRLGTFVCARPDGQAVEKQRAVVRQLLRADAVDLAVVVAMACLKNYCRALSPVIVPGSERIAARARRGVSPRALSCACRLPNSTALQAAAQKLA